MTVTLEKNPPNFFETPAQKYILDFSNHLHCSASTCSFTVTVGNPTEAPDTQM